MFKKIQSGTTMNVQGLECNLPPVGYVLNKFNGKVEKRDIITRSNKTKDQYWERTPLPDWFNKKYSEEEERKKTDPDFSFPEIDEIVSREWDRRINGCWFMNNGEPVYLTGMHYMYLQWWCIDIGYPKFRYPDLEYFYFLQYCIEDPECMGMCEVTKRRFGKTFRSGLFLYEYTSRTNNANSGLQSKTTTDAKKVFSKAVISPFKKLPKFFRPEYDKSQGITPKSELRFQQTNVKGKKAEELLDKEELESVIDFQSSDEVAYDGQKLYRYCRDEAGKTMEADVYDSHDVVRYCLLDDEGRIIGRALYTTTVEEMESGGAAFKKLWQDSDHLNKMENGRTPSGLYRFFMSAKKTRNFDAYGRPNEQKTLDQILLDRKSIAHNARALSARIRKEPLTIEEAFRVDGDVCLYNSELLNDQLDRLTWGDNFTERGDFVWADGERDTYVEWRKNPRGKFEIATMIPEELQNKILKRGSMPEPNNRMNFVAGCDPYQFDKTKDKRRSMGTGFVYWKHNSAYGDNPFNDTFIVRYCNRPEIAKVFYEDMIKMCVFFGCQILVERNAGKNMIDYVKERGYGNFLIWLPGEVEAGISANAKTHQELAEASEEYINDRISKCFFKDLIQQWLEFDIGDTEKFDEAMGAGWTLVATKTKFKAKDKESNLIPINKLFKSVPINAN